MNRIYIIAATKVSNLLLGQLKTNLFSVTSWDIGEPSKIPMSTTMGTSRVLTKHARNYNTRASLDSGARKNRDRDTKSMSSYWGVAASSLTKAIGSFWKWNSFRVTKVVQEGCEECK